MYSADSVGVWYRKEKLFNYTPYLVNDSYKSAVCVNFI